jgi:hypothetical protein
MAHAETVEDSAVYSTLSASIAHRQRSDEPYTHWILSNVFPASSVAELAKLSFPVTNVGDVSGRRELHNATRHYFDPANIAKYKVCREIAEVLQSPSMVGQIAKAFGTSLDGTYLRIEFAQDAGNFWLEPHTDLGVKKFTMLYYLSADAGHRDLGTDIYRNKETHFGRPPFIQNTALIFVPSDKTWHGFEKRDIPGVRKSVIINYVTTEWRAREQLAWGENPVRAG